MFDSIRDTIHNVQEGISASLRGLAVSDTPSRRIRTSSGQIVNYNAGAELLHKYQSEWQELHQLAEDNAKNAEVVDVMVGELHKNLEKQWTDVGNLCSTLGTMPQLLNKVQELMEDIGSLRDLFEEVEGSLLALEDLAETQALREEQLDHRFQLAMYKEKRLQELEEVRGQLVSQHKDRVKKHEAQQQKLLQERQSAFGQAFEEQMDEYKKSGQIPKLAEVRASLDREPSLEEVDLEEDSSALDAFLQDEAQELGSSQLPLGQSLETPPSSSDQPSLASSTHSSIDGES